MYEHALVIGKFWPAHNGHIHLIDAASSGSKKVTVLIYVSKAETLIAERFAILAHHYQGTNVTVRPIYNAVYEDYDDPNIWEAHDAILKAYIDGARVKFDAIYSSEPYGDVMAAGVLGGATAVQVDGPRGTFPISGTMVRNDPAKHWGMLPLSARQVLMPRIVVLGAESSGTTTLSMQLAEHYNARWIPEFGREYTEHLLKSAGSMENIVWTAHDFEEIANEQQYLENESVAALGWRAPILIADTDSLATAVWEQRYIGTPWKTADHMYPERPPRDLYIVTDHVGVSFEQDGIRDGEHLREGMTDEFIQAVVQSGYPWIKVRGTRRERFDIAVKMIDRAIAAKLKFQ